METDSPTHISNKKHCLSPCTITKGPHQCYIRSKQDKVHHFNWCGRAQFKITQTVTATKHPYLIWLFLRTYWDKNKVEHCFWSHFTHILSCYRPPFPLCVCVCVCVNIDSKRRTRKLNAVTWRQIVCTAVINWIAQCVWMEAIRSDSGKVWQTSIDCGAGELYLTPLESILAEDLRSVIDGSRLSATLLIIVISIRICVFKHDEEW